MCLLYELLAGSTPFDAKELMAGGIEAMRKTIRETEPSQTAEHASSPKNCADVRRRYHLPVWQFDQIDRSAPTHVGGYD